jgi:hypothetical protein
VYNSSSVASCVTFGAAGCQQRDIGKRGRCFEGVLGVGLKRGPGSVGPVALRPDGAPDASVGNTIGVTEGTAESPTGASVGPVAGIPDGAAGALVGKTLGFSEGTEDSQVGASVGTTRGFVDGIGQNPASVGTTPGVTEGIK